MADLREQDPCGERSAPRPGPPPDERSALVRAFIALELNDDVRGELARAGDRLRRIRAHVGWVPRQNLHLSLVFLGNVTAECAEAVSLALDEAAAVTRCFSVEVTGVGTFGSRASPRVIWAGVRPPRLLAALHEQIVRRLQDLEVPFDAKPLRPHVTLGRVRSARGRQDLVKALDGFADTPFGRVELDSVVLMRSDLLPGGARYSVLHRAAFEG
jgi:2'-5' RNA ligase